MAVIFSLTAGAACLAEETAKDLPPQPVNAEGTAVLSGEKPIPDGKGNASFTITIAKMGIADKIRLLRSDRTAIIFTGSGDEPGRLCPFFNLNIRKYEVDEIKPDVYKITAPITGNDVEKIEKSGCIVTTAPDRNKIKYLPVEPHS